MNVTVFAAIDLALLIVTAVFGLASLLAWRRHRAAGSFPVRKIATHVSLQLLGIVIWLVFVLQGQVLMAWAAFIVLTAGQVVGDLLMLVSYRARNPTVERIRYLAVGGEVLSFKRVAPAFHALIGAIAWFGMLAICIFATVTG